MKGKLFIDTNILIYLFGEHDIDKKRKSSDFILESHKKNQHVWSTQVMQEYYHNMTKKYNHDPLKVRESLSTFEPFELVVNDALIIKNAIDIQVKSQLSFWDSLIISSAVSTKCSYLITEDLHHGQKIEGLEIVNPFLI